MRLYKFYSPKWGIEALEKKRLKVSRINELNDPFDFYGIDLSDPQIRSRFSGVVSDYNSIFGLICFSRHWSNPVLWSHYANSHEGIALGFDVDVSAVQKVIYSSKRIPSNFIFCDDLSQKISSLRESLVIKYSHWRYENEYRAFLDINEAEKDGNHMFYEFSKVGTLKEIIVGVRYKERGLDISDLGIDSESVKFTTSRLSFSRFKIVTQKRKSLHKTL